MTEPEQLEFPTPESRADQIFRAFLDFHRLNPHVWDLFDRFTLQIIARGYEHYSCNAIFERIRWHVAVETTSNDPLKLNNNFRAYYARMFMAKHAQHDEFFRNRKRTSADKPAEDVDIQYWPSASPDDESSLMAQLRRL